LAQDVLELLDRGPIFGDMAGRFAETALTFLRDEWPGQ
jgi:hypothetical protein